MTPEEKYRTLRRQNRTSKMGSLHYDNVHGPDEVLEESKDDRLAKWREDTRKDNVYTNTKIRRKRFKPSGDMPPLREYSVTGGRRKRYSRVKKSKTKRTKRRQSRRKRRH